MSHGDSGRTWEKAAESFLRQRGLRTLERNYHSRFGEIDLIMADAGCLVFVEVRYRRHDSRGRGADTVDRRKMRRIVLTARYFLAGHPGLAAGPCRFDVISMGGDPKETRIEWIRDAFQAT